MPTERGPFDVVLANLVAGILIAIAPQLTPRSGRVGTLLASGIIADRVAEVRTAFEATGLRVAASTSEGDWVALELRRA